MAYQPRELRNQFGKNATLYEEARPQYPVHIINEVIRISRIPDTGTVMDVGCGNGNATIPFGERGYLVLGIDPSTSLIEIAQAKSRHLPNVRYIVGDFETVDFPAQPVDLVIFAQSLHWIDPTRGYPRIADHMKDTSTLAAFWNFERYEAGGLVGDVRELYLKHCSTFPPELGSSQGYITKLETSKLFGPITEYIHHWDLTIMKDQYLKLISSWSWVSSLDEEEHRLAFFQDLSALLAHKPEKLSIPYKTVLLTTQKKN